MPFEGLIYACSSVALAPTFLLGAVACQSRTIRTLELTHGDPDLGHAQLDQIGGSPQLPFTVTAVAGAAGTQQAGPARSVAR
jgi:hypothetical protein